MDILMSITLLVNIIFYIYKFILSLIKKNKKKFKIENKEINIISNNIDIRIHSNPSYDFPNLQNEFDMKIINSGSDPCAKQEKIQVKQYCKY